MMTTTNNLREQIFHEFISDKEYSERCPLEYAAQQSEKVRRAARQSRTKHDFTNFRVGLILPKPEHTFEAVGYIVADSAESGQCRVFHIPDAGCESQQAVARWGCDAMNKHERYTKLLEAAKLLIAMNNCNYDRDQMRRSGGFKGLSEAVEAIDPNWLRKDKEPCK